MSSDTKWAYRLGGFVLVLADGRLVSFSDDKSVKVWDLSEDLTHSLLQKEEKLLLNNVKNIRAYLS